MSDQTIRGGRELDAFLKSLPAKVEKNIMRAALRAGANVIKAEAKENVAVDQGDLRRSVRVSTSAKGGIVKASVKAGDKRAWYWRFVEFGTAAHMIRPKKARALDIGGKLASAISHPGAKAKPFMRPALDAKGDAAVAAVADKIRSRLSALGIDAPAPGRDGE